MNKFTIKIQIKKYYLAVMGLTAFASFGLIQPVQAEATREIFSDAGLYSGENNDLRMKIDQWSHSAVVFDAKYKGDPNPPEGKEVLRVEVQNVGYGGVGFFFVNPENESQYREVSFTDYSQGHIRFWLKSTGPLKLELKSIIDGREVTAVLRDPDTGQEKPMASTNDQWVEVVLPLSLWGSRSLNKDRIRAPFTITSDKPTLFYVDHVRYTKPVADIEVHPSSVDVNPGKHRQFTIDAFDAAGEVVLAYGQFSVDQSVGVLRPQSSQFTQSTRLTANYDDGPVRAQIGTLNASAQVNNTQENLDQVFGIISETYDGLVLDEDSKLALFKSDTSEFPEVTAEPSDRVEGFESLKISVNLPKPESTSGLFVYWGTEDIKTEVLVDSNTMDMSNYYDGALRFWIKGPAILNDKLWVGIRSGNIPGGKETSIYQIQDYATLDGTWKAVSIPFEDLAGGRPFADLSRIKNFFTVSVSSYTQGEQTFYIDNVRWDTRRPGNLTGLEIIPPTVVVPLGAHREFVAVGTSVGADVDVTAQWDMPDRPLGTLSTTIGPRVRLTASNTPVEGRLRAQFDTHVATSQIKVRDIDTTQQLHIYTDIGVAGPIGVSTGPAIPTSTNLTLKEIIGTDDDKAPEGSKYMRATYTLDNSDGEVDAYAGWFVEDGIESRYLRYYRDGYLRFYVRTTRDLQISIRSANTDGGEELSKVFLSELGIPLDGKSWQEVIISLADFRFRDPERLDFDQIKVYFSIFAVSRVIKEGEELTFDIDDIRWLTDDQTVVDSQKIYQGIINQQQDSGLVRSLEGQDSAYTYDQALAAMSFTYEQDYLLSRKIFDVYMSKYEANRNGFAGFADDYHAVNLNPLDDDKLVGPNAWMGLALIHHKNASGSDAYDSLITALANWVSTFIDSTDGGVFFGNPVKSDQRAIKSTEHNMDAYAFLNAAYKVTGNEIYKNNADGILQWLRTSAWNSDEDRFNVGIRADGSKNTDRALDVYSWAPLALSSYTSVLELAVDHFGTTSVNSRNDAVIEGFDFSGFQDQPVDKDAVWLEGTAQMVVAYWAIEDKDNAVKYLDELKKAVLITSPEAQGLTYATQGGTAYPDFRMDFQNQSVSAAAWFLFADKNFNPFQVFPIHELTVRSISTGQEIQPPRIRWVNVDAGDGWTRADSVIELRSQPINTQPWGIQILTDNSKEGLVPRFLDPTLNLPNNPDSNPAGLLWKDNGDTTSHKLPLAWSIKETTETLPSPANPNHIGENNQPLDNNSFQWFFLKDLKTPNIDNPGDEPDIEEFQNGESYVVIRQIAPLLEAGVTGQIHGSQGPANFFDSYSPDYLFFEADFLQAGAQANYGAVIYLEFFTE